MRPRRAVLQGAEFKELWDRIKHKTTYRVQFDNDGLIAQSTRALQDAPQIPRTRLQWRNADIAIGQAGVQATERSGAATVVLDERDIPLPDILTELQDRTRLTRRSIQRILSDSGRLDDFKRNPQAFIELAAQAINRCKRQALVDGIKYQRLGDDHYYAQELFEYESDVEARFADQLEKNAAVKVYAKLPGWFAVPIPLGAYRPDWAVLGGHWRRGPGCIWWTRRKAASTRTTYASPKTPRSSAAARTSRRWRCGTFLSVTRWRRA